jgi:hypothetical protein
MPLITDFLTNFKGGTRVNRFRVSSENGVPVVGNDIYDIHIRATAFPDLTITPVPIGFRGKIVKIPSTRTFTPWTFTVMDDAMTPEGNQANNLHHKFMNWSNSFSPTGEKLGIDLLSKASGVSTSATPNWKLEHLSSVTTTGDQPSILKSFMLFGCWPIQVGPLQLDMSVDNQLSFFNVTLAYSHLG